MKSPFDSASIIAITACTYLAGCSFLKPAPDTARHFVLTPLPVGGPTGVAPGASLVGVGQVRVPPYLFNSSLAVRKGTNEIEYSSQALWAERLDTGIPRVLVADLSSLLPRDRVRSSVGGGDVATEIGVTIEQFDVSSSGQAVLVATWRIRSAEGATILRTGESRLSRQGPSPDTDPSGAVTTLSNLIADLSRQLAPALKETTPALAHE